MGVVIRQSRRLWPTATLAVAMATGSAAAANPTAGVRVTNAATGFDLVYASSASALGGYVTSDNAPLATVPRGTTDAFTITSTGTNALAGALIYRAAGDPSRECTFRYTLTYAGGRFVLLTDARASWTGQVVCTATPAGPDKAKGDFTVTFTMK
jgi:hypothetical protein